MNAFYIESVKLCHTNLNSKSIMFSLDQCITQNSSLQELDLSNSNLSLENLELLSNSLV